jgi:hypothetical protein
VTVGSNLSDVIQVTCGYFVSLTFQCVGISPFSVSGFSVWISSSLSNSPQAR